MAPAPVEPSLFDATAPTAGHLVLTARKLFASHNSPMSFRPKASQPDQEQTGGPHLYPS